jgi:hypothetical protein
MINNMKIFIANILAKTLDKIGCTVIIGVKIKGEAHTHRNTQFL